MNEPAPQTDSAHFAQPQRSKDAAPAPKAAQTDSAHITQPQHKKEEALLPKKGNIISSIRQHPLFLEVALIVVVVFAITGWLYWNDMQSKIYIENAEIRAPLVSLGPSQAGTIDSIYVKEGDRVVHGQRLASVSGQLITAPTSGVIIAIAGKPGQLITPQNAVVTMVNPDDFRVVGKLQEDKGLKDVKPGQKVVFTVDAFGDKQYNGTVESVGMTPVQSDIVFSISDKRQEKQFEIKAIFDTSAYPELKDGMSTKMSIYK